jgi:hypothetical protein
VECLVAAVEVAAAMGRTEVVVEAAAVVVGLFVQYMRAT